VPSLPFLEVTRQTIKISMDLHLPKPTTLMALIDSGAGGNFIDEETIKQLQLTRTEL
jgi:hypothetical protein